jgi:hypothetical protein
MAEATTLICRIRAAHPWLSDEWEEATLRELAGGKKRAEKAIATLRRLVENLQPWEQQPLFRETGT